MLVPAHCSSPPLWLCLRSSVLYNIEYDPTIDACVRHWTTAGVPSSFLRDHPAGVAWGCEACDATVPAKAGLLGAAALVEAEQLLALRCDTCLGYPAGHPECKGVAFAQTFQSIP